MTYAQRENGLWSEIPIGQSVTIDDAVYSYGTIEIWSQADRETVGIFEIVETEVPAGKRSVGSSIVDQEGRPVRTHQLEDVPPPPPPPPAPPIEITADVLFGERMTDGEYDELDMSIRARETARVYRGWAAATSFTEGTAMWTLLDKHLSRVVTDERKAELLARPIQSAALAGGEALAA